MQSSRQAVSVFNDFCGSVWLCKAMLKDHAVEWLEEALRRANVSATEFTGFLLDQTGSRCRMAIGFGDVQVLVEWRVEHFPHHGSMALLQSEVQESHWFFI